MNTSKSDKISMILQAELYIRDMDNNIVAIADLIRGKQIDVAFGQQLLYSDIGSPYYRLRRMLLFVIMLNESSNLKDDWLTPYVQRHRAHSRSHQGWQIGQDLQGRLLCSD